jgi:hypothetical protein
MIYLELEDLAVTQEFEHRKRQLENFPIDQVGEILARGVQDTILDIPLYKTGFLYESVYWEYGNATEVIVDDRAEYSGYLDQGTKYIEGYHFLEITPEMESEVDDFLDKFWGD